MPAETAPKNLKGSYASGIGVVWGLNLLQIILTLNLAGFVPGAAENDRSLLTLSLRFFGLSQLLYVFPLLYWAHRNRTKQYSVGVAIGAAVTFLLSTACWAVMSN